MTRRASDGDEDRMERALIAWGAWVASGGRCDGYARTNVLHPSWTPARSNSAGLGLQSNPRRAEKELDRKIGRLCDRLSGTLAVVYVRRLCPEGQAATLRCAESTVRARVREAKAALVEMG